MARDRDFSELGKVLAAPARSAMLNLLMDGTTRPAGELAHAAGVSTSTASEHLRTLADSGLVRVTARGRHRYFTLAGDDVAGTLEALGALSPGIPVTSYRRSREADRLAAARLCYDHLAGRLAVALADAWVAHGWLRDRQVLALTDTGRERLGALGIEVATAPGSRRPLTRACLDWTERRPHLAGSLGAAVAAHARGHGWVEAHAAGRGLDVTPHGHAVLEEEWGLTLGPGPVGSAS